MPTLETIISKNIELRKLKVALKSQLQENQISFPELEIIFIVNEQKETSPTFLADYLYIERATISRLLKLLYEKSLITYTNDSVDRRKVYVAVSKKGASIIKAINKAI